MTHPSRMGPTHAPRKTPACMIADEEATVSRLALTTAGHRTPCAHNAHDPFRYLVRTRARDLALCAPRRTASR